MLLKVDNWRVNFIKKSMSSCIIERDSIPRKLTVFMLLLLYEAVLAVLFGCPNVFSLSLPPNPGHQIDKRRHCGWVCDQLNFFALSSFTNIDIQREEEVEELKGVRGDLRKETVSLYFSHTSQALSSFLLQKVQKNSLQSHMVNVSEEVAVTVHVPKGKQQKTKLLVACSREKPYQLRDFDAMTTSYILLVHVQELYFTLPITRPNMPAYAPMLDSIPIILA